MKVRYSKSFKKAVEKLSGKQLDSVLDVIREVKAAQGIEDITDCVRLVGYHHVYRIRIGGYRAFFTFHVEIVDDVVYFHYLVSRGQAYTKKVEKELKRLDTQYNLILNNMRKIFIIATCITILASCSSKTNEQKARELIEPDIKSHLINPESYEFAEMKLDSCFSDDIARNADFTTFALKVVKLYKEYKKYMSDAENAESAMNVYAPSYEYQSALFKQQLKKYKAEMEKSKRKAAIVKEKILQMYKDNEKMFLAVKDGKHEFVGWAASISFRVETAGGLKTMGGILYFLNKDLTKITAQFTEEDFEDLEDSSIEDVNYEFEDDLRKMFGTD